MTLTTVIPVYNELDTIDEILHRVESTGLVSEIVIVDDYSIDGTRERLQEIATSNPIIKLHLHDRNYGKGKAVQTGIQAATSDLILIQDADLEYDPNDYPVLLAPIEANKADVVYGSRFMGGPRRSTMFWHMIANKLLTLMTNLLYNSILTDMETGYKLFRKELIQSIEIKSTKSIILAKFSCKTPLVSR